MTGRAKRETYRNQLGPVVGLSRQQREPQAAVARPPIACGGGERVSVSGGDLW